MKMPPYPNNIGKEPRRWIGIDGHPVRAEIVDEVYVRQRALPNKYQKLIYLQKIQFDGRRIEYRFTYYMEGSKGKTEGKWVFGQYSLVVPSGDLIRLLEKARLKGWKGF